MNVRVGFLTLPCRYLDTVSCACESSTHLDGRREWGRSCQFLSSVHSHPRGRRVPSSRSVQHDDSLLSPPRLHASPLCLPHLSQVRQPESLCQGKLGVENEVESRLVSWVKGGALNWYAAEPLCKDTCLLGTQLLLFFFFSLVSALSFFRPETLPAVCSSKILTIKMPKLFQ